MKILERFGRRKPLPARVASGLARRAGQTVKAVGRVATSVVGRR